MVVDRRQGPIRAGRFDAGMQPPAGRGRRVPPTAPAASANAPEMPPAPPVDPKREMSYVAATTRSAPAGLGSLSPEEVREINEAIAAAELHTSAEIRVVVSRGSLVQHPFFSVMWSSLIALVLPWAIVVAWPMSALSILQVQAIIFLVVAGVLMLPQMIEKAVPRLALKAAARAAAVEAFLAHGLSKTHGRTGVLIFLAAHERLVEVVADEGVHGPMGPVAWAEICETISRQARQGSLVEGLVAAVRRTGELLASPMPPRPGDVNDLSDRVMVI